MLAVGVVLIGTVMTLLGSYGLGISLPDMVGILCGATTNTPALGAAQQTLKQMGIEANTPALGCAVAYPLGVVGVILGILMIRKALVRKEDLEIKEKDDANKPYIVAFQVHNPAIFNMSVKDIAQLSYPKFVISRLWRDGNVSIPTSEKVIKEGDRLLVITSEKNVPALTVLFGEQENTDWNKEDIDWNAIDSQLISQRIVVTRPELNGKKLGSLHLRNHYGINISRVYRSGVLLLATAELTLQLGDRLTVVGEAAAIQNVERVLGNAVKSLKEPNLVAVFVGIILGLALGAIPIAIPGVSTPVKLGLAGGPIIVGILLGTFGPRIHMITYTTRSANLMLRALGLSMYLACLGLDAGAHFFDTVFRPEGLLWIALGAGLTIIPTVLVGFIAFKIMKIDFGSVSGMLCGSMANPMALNYANDTIPGDNPSVAYATVYPLCMFLRVHSVLLVGEEGLGAGFAARCIAADYLYPAGGAPAEALLRGECCRAVGKAGKRDSGQIETGIVREAISVEGMGAGGRYLVSQVTAMRSEIFNTSLSAEGRAVLLYHVERMNEESANALLKAPTHAPMPGAPSTDLR